MSQEWKLPNTRFHKIMNLFLSFCSWECFSTLPSNGILFPRPLPRILISWERQTDGEARETSGLCLL